MCLIVKEGCEPEIAKKDIVCYKLVGSCGDYGWESIYNCSEHTFKWNEVETARNRFYNRINDCWKEFTIQHLNVDARGRINAGFHARLEKIDSNDVKERICIIPAGTEYCFGSYNEVVAVQMIVFRTYLDYYMYRLKKFFKVSIKTK